MEKDNFKKLIISELERVISTADILDMEKYYIGKISGIILLYRSYLNEENSIEYLDHERDIVNRLEEEYESMLYMKLDNIKKNERAS